jgi:hypothetical protein
MTITRIGLGTLGLALAVAVASPGVSFAQGQDPAGQQNRERQDQQRQDEQRQDQQREDQQRQDQQRQDQDQQRNQARRTITPIEGQLKAVGTEKQIVLVDRTSGDEVLFYFDEQTQVQGKSGGVQGLAGQPGTMIRVHYRAEGERAIAERIEILGQNQAERPSDGQPDRQPEDRPQPQQRPEAPQQRPEASGEQPRQQN